jgi:hypothetical protein
MTEPWKSMCFPCYAAAHPERYPNRRQFAELPRPAPVEGVDYRAENAFLQHKITELMLLTQLMKNHITQLEQKQVSAPPFDADMLGRLIRLCHPDRHNNSEASNLATQYLLKLRNDKS